MDSANCCFVMGDEASVEEPAAAAAAAERGAAWEIADAEGAGGGAGEAGNGLEGEEEEEEELLSGTGGAGTETPPEGAVRPPLFNRLFLGGPATKA